MNICTQIITKEVKKNMKKKIVNKKAYLGYILFIRMQAIAAS